MLHKRTTNKDLLKLASFRCDADAMLSWTLNYVDCRLWRMETNINLKPEVWSGQGACYCSWKDWIIIASKIYTMYELHDKS